jgi:hypothetical protein
MIITDETTIKEIKKSAPENTSAIDLMITFNACDITYRTKRVAQLSNNGMIMRDINGKWIK